MKVRQVKLLLPQSRTPVVEKKKQLELLLPQSRTPAVEKNEY